MSTIFQVQGRMILDSRGNPTVEVEVVTEDGARGRCGSTAATASCGHVWCKRMHGRTQRDDGEAPKKVHRTKLSLRRASRDLEVQIWGEAVTFRAETQCKNPYGTPILENLLIGTKNGVD